MPPVGGNGGKQNGGRVVTPLQFITVDCANLESDGSCRGIMIAPDLTMRVCRPLPRCLVAEGKRCEYVETCVAPMADWTTEPRLAASRQAAVAEYRRITKQGEDLTRQCPECGGPMRKGKQYCPECADARRKASNRAAQARHRRNGDALSAEVQNFQLKSPMISIGNLASSQNPIGDSHPPQNDRTSADRTQRKTTP